MQTNALAVLAELVLFVGILFPGILLWTKAIRLWLSGKPLIPGQSRLAPWGVVDLGIALGIWLVSSFLASSIAREIIGVKTGTSLESLEPSMQIPLLWIGGVASLVTCLAVAAALFARHRVSLADLGWNPRFFWGDVLLGLKAFAMLAPVVYGIQLVLTQLVESKHPLIEMLEQNPNPGFFIVAGFAAVVVAPIAEEFVFRVLLQGWLERLFRGNDSTESLVFGGHQEQPTTPLAPPEIVVAESTSSPTFDPANPYSSPAEIEATSPLAEHSDVRPPRVTPILISSAFFALSHWSHGPDPIPLFVFAMGLGYLYQRTHRIMPCIVLHFLLNACSLAALWMMVGA